MPSRVLPDRATRTIAHFLDRAEDVAASSARAAGRRADAPVGRRLPTHGGAPVRLLAPGPAGCAAAPFRPGRSRVSCAAARALSAIREPVKSWVRIISAHKTTACEWRPHGDEGKSQERTEPWLRSCATGRSGRWRVGRLVQSRCHDRRGERGADRGGQRRDDAPCRRLGRSVRQVPGRRSPAQGAGRCAIGNRANARQRGLPWRYCVSSTRSQDGASAPRPELTVALVETPCAGPGPARLVGRGRLARLGRKEFAPVCAGRRILEHIPSMKYTPWPQAGGCRRSVRRRRKPPAHACGQDGVAAPLRSGSAQGASDPSAPLAPRPAAPAHGFPRSHGPSKSLVDHHRLRAG
jgi:hypothetical protein